MNEAIGARPAPDSEDSGWVTEWARGAEIHAGWLRDVAPQHGFDVSKVILGDVLNSIMGDDFNCLITSDTPFVPRNAATGKEQLLIRLKWEIDTPELPERIKKRLERVKQVLERIDWQTEGGFGRARTLWTRRVRGFVQKEITKHPEYQEAREYADELEVETSRIPPTE